MPERNSQRSGMTARRAFRWFFVLGCILVVLNVPFLLGNMPAVRFVLSLLTAPGTLLTLPFHNVAPAAGWGVVGLIAIGNGLVFGLAAYLFARVRHRWFSSGTRRR